MPNGLGRGLSSLIPNKNTPPSSGPNINGTGDTRPVAAAGPGSDKDKVLKIDISRIEVNPLQPRRQFTDVNLDELVESIKKHGVIQPLVVSQSGDRYELIAGERRLRASKKAGLKDVPVIVREVKDEQQKLEVALIENIQREDLNPIDLAVAYSRLVDEFHLTQEDVAREVGKSRSAVTNCLRLLSLPEEIKLALIGGRISEGHAKYLVGLDSEAKQMNLFRKILMTNLTVGDTGKEARRMGGTKQARIKINYADKDKEFALREFFGAKAEIKRRGKGGQIIIDFYSEEELGEIIGKIK
ncbi:MAG: ParB/RepB/Spo0J family partition protein [Candidatus Falkowbacteria bacterium]